MLCSMWLSLRTTRTRRCRLLGKGDERATRHLVAASRICLDVTPTLAGPLPEPGLLHEMGGAAESPGGRVSAMWRIAPPSWALCPPEGAVAGDALCRLVRPRLCGLWRDLDKNLQARSDGPTSHRVGLSPPEVDRRFVQCLGL